MKGKDKNIKQKRYSLKIPKVPGAITHKSSTIGSQKGS